MPNVPLDTRFIGIAPQVNLTERKSALINAETQPYSMQDIVDTAGGGSYLKYVALLTQTGENAPVATILENTIGNVSFSYGIPGLYNVTIPESSPGKLWISITQNSNNDYGYIMYDMDNVGNPTINSFSLYCYNFNLTNPVNFTLSDDVLYGTSIEIRVYP